VKRDLTVAFSSLSKGDKDFVDKLTGKDMPHGQGALNGSIIKWFRDKSPQ